MVYSTVRPNQLHHGIMGELPKNALASTGFAVIRSSHDLSLSPLIYLALTDPAITQAMQQLAETSTSTIPSIRPSDLLGIEVFVPNSEEGIAISKRIAEAFNLIEINHRETDRLMALRDTLLPKLMSGEIDVSALSTEQLVV